MIAGTARCGLPRLRSSARMRPRPGRMPEPCSESSHCSAGLVATEELQEAGEGRLHLGAGRDQVDHPMLDEKLGALETFRESLADRLLDDARPGESDERLRLGDVEVAEHRV